MRLRPSAAKATAKDTSSAPDRDRSTPQMSRLRPTAAKRASGRIPAPRPRLRSRFRRVRPRVSSWSPPSPRRAGVGAGGLRIRARFSRNTVERTVSGHYIGQDTLDRWATIQAGGVPEDDDVKPPPTPDQVDEAEQEATAEVEAWGRQREQQIREEADEARAAGHREADSLEADAATADPRARSALMRRAHAVREHADEEYRAAQREMDRVAEEVREQRAEVRAELRRQVEAMSEAYDHRAAELKAGLDREVEDTVKRFYFHNGEPDEIEDWQLE